MPIGMLEVGLNRQAVGAKYVQLASQKQVVIMLWDFWHFSSRIKLVYNQLQCSHFVCNCSTLLAFLKVMSKKSDRCTPMQALAAVVLESSYKPDLTVIHGIAVGIVSISCADFFSQMLNMSCSKVAPSLYNANSRHGIQVSSRKKYQVSNPLALKPRELIMTETKYDLKIPLMMTTKRWNPSYGTKEEKIARSYKSNAMILLLQASKRTQVFYDNNHKSLL